MSPYDRQLQREYSIPVPVSKVWNAWTTQRGIESFFGENAKIGEAPGEPFEIYFLMDAPIGSRGSEGCIILRKEPMKRFAFTWNAPPDLQEIRNQNTVVELRFSSIDSANTTLEFYHTGWGEGIQWDRAFDYFNKAWFDLVIPNLLKHLTHKDAKSAS